MTLLDYSNLIINPFEPQKQDPFYSTNYDVVNDGYFPSEAELLCFDPLPPSLFDFNPPPPLNLDEFHFPHDLHFDELIIPNNNDNFLDNYPIIEDYSINPPPPYPTEDSYPFVQDFSDQFFPFPKKHKVSFPENYPSYPHFSYYDNININNNNNVGLGVTGGKVREVTAQSKAARERRRRITEKTQELGKLVPGGTKMNTAEMFQAAAKYVKFLQAQLSLLNTIQNLPQESIKEAKLSNLPILGSVVVQEKLYTKDKCLFPMDFLPILEKHLDFEANPTISKDINDLIH